MGVREGTVLSRLQLEYEFTLNPNIYIITSMFDPICGNVNIDIGYEMSMNIETLETSCQLLIAIS